MSTPFPRARKRFGQHFLEPAWVARLVNLVAPAAGDTFLEIGPGRGALTRVLAPRVRHVVAVEIDRDLAAALPGTVPANVTVIEGDFLAMDVAGLLREAHPTVGIDVRPARVIGNLPYNISSPILFKLLAASDDGRAFSDATLMLQKEVVDRLTAAPGSGDYGTLAIQVARVAEIDRLLTLPPGAFRPPPRVTSAVVRLRFRPPTVDVGDAETFEKVVRGMFLQRRKTLGNALRPVTDARGLAAGEVLERAGVDSRRRPETLALDEIARICRAML
jgi:16S rRNA (adenine1518-N6/adenine1519-N6)-dimethyltransferase